MTTLDQKPPEMGVPTGYMKDAQGRLVPSAAVKIEHKLEDQLVRGLLDRAFAASAELKRFREHSFSGVNTFLDLLTERYGAPRGGAKGNVTLTSFDGMLRVQLAVSDQLSFGPELQIAKSMVDVCIRGWSQGANVNLQAIVLDAFAVDKKGKVNVDRILALRRLNIEDDADGSWQRAMAVLSDAVRVERSKEYLRFYKRNNTDEKFEQVPMDLASV